MKIELLILLIFGFLIANTYYDNKLLEKIKSWKKFYKMAFYGFIGLCVFLIIKKTPNKSYEMLNHANQFIKFMPIDRNAKNLFEPFIDFTKNSFKNNPNINNPNANYSINNFSSYNQSSGEKRILNSGKQSTKRSVSETKKKFVAAQQNWHCKKCQKQLPAWFEVDHVMKLEYGGSNSIDNLEALCRDCHGQKTAMENL
jgi:hypothetical protein